MCGIVGCISKKNNLSYIIEGLKRLEYRGYDSSGVCIIKDNKYKNIRAVGKVKALEDKIINEIDFSNISIAHTRWATHGRVNETNAHPHIVEGTAIVHNGIIENYIELKQQLNNDNIVSETDTEIIAHLIEKHYTSCNDYLKAISLTINSMKGMFSLAILNLKTPDTMYLVKKGTPLSIGRAKDAIYVASDIHPLLNYADSYAFLEDGEIAEISLEENVKVMDFNLNLKNKEFKKIDFTIQDISKGTYRYFMEKEIFEQAQVIIETIKNKISADRTRILFDDTPIKNILNNINNIKIVACGTAWHAGLIGKYLFEKISLIPVEVDLASEFRYRDVCVDNKTLIIFISQSGETADTLASLDLAKKKNAFTLAICNRENSSLHRLADYTLFTQAGLEIGVAATKSFTSQIAVLLLLTYYSGYVLNKINKAKLSSFINDFVKVPFMIQEILNNSSQIEDIVKSFISNKTFLFIARGIQFPIALEGALKLKETSYIHAEGYASGELKHGPIALVDEEVCVVAVSLLESLYEKNYSNIEEVKARGGKIFAICSEDDVKLSRISDELFKVPNTRWEFIPLLSSIPVQLFAFYFALHKGTDLDKPRNLAKSVTVE